MPASRRAYFKRAAGYAGDALNLPVDDILSAVPYYERRFGFTVMSRDQSPYARVVLGRDDVKIGLIENGGDPTQDGCYFEVDDVEAAFEEIKGHPPVEGDIPVESGNGRPCRAFFMIAPDGLCYMIAQPLDEARG